MLSKRATGWLEGEYGLMEGMKRVMANPFDLHTRPSGCINLGTAENVLMLDWLKAKWNKIKLNLELDQEDFNYGDFTGSAAFKQALLHFLRNQLAIPASVHLKPEDVHLMNGCGTVVESLFHVVCDPNDTILIPSPYYGGFDMDVERRAGVRIHPVPLTADNGYQLTVEDCERALQESKRTVPTSPVRALLVMNPNNPLGCIYTPQTIRELVAFCIRRGMHCVVDEIYAFSVLDTDEENRFESVLSMLDDVADPSLVHWIWGFSKDFCMNGMRAGILISKNKHVMRGVNEIAYFCGTPSLLQTTLASYLDYNDCVPSSAVGHGWTDEWQGGQNGECTQERIPWPIAFLQTNTIRLRAARTHILHHIQRFNETVFRVLGYHECGSVLATDAQFSMNAKPARVSPCTAGFFLWCDLSYFLIPFHVKQDRNGRTENTETRVREETKTAIEPVTDDQRPKGSFSDMAKRERELFLELIEDGRVYIAPGTMAFHDRQPGWFRIVFAHPKEVMDIAMRRLFRVLGKRIGYDWKE